MRWSDGSFWPPVPVVGSPRSPTVRNGWSGSLLRISTAAVLIVIVEVLDGLKTTLTISDPPAGIVSGRVGAGENAKSAASTPVIFSPSDGIDSGAVPVLRMTNCSGGLFEPPRGSLKY